MSCGQLRRTMYRPVALRCDAAVGLTMQLGLRPAPAPSRAAQRQHRSNNGAFVRPIPVSCNAWVLYRMHLLDHMLAIAEAIHAGGWDRARHLLELLSQRVSTMGDARQRVASCFFEALAARYSRLNPVDDPLESLPILSGEPSSEARLSSFMALNQVTPFLRFAHLTATQTLLEALTRDGDELLHIVDVDVTGYGAQWPFFLQALAAKRREDVCEYIKRIRITGIGRELTTLRSTGEALDSFARKLHLPFEFIPVVQADLETLTPEMLNIEEGEAVGVNCIMQLHTLLAKGPEMLTNFLAMVETVAPKVVTVAEAEANLNSTNFLDRFQHAWNFYSALFETLDSTLPPTSAQRARVESDWYRAEICNVVAYEGSDRTVRSQPYSLWKKFFEGNGFEIHPPSWRTLSQAQFLLKIHHPTDEYKVRVNEERIVLGWRGHPLFNFSSWKMAEMEDLSSFN